MAWVRGGALAGRQARSTPAVFIRALRVVPVITEGLPPVVPRPRISARVAPPVAIGDVLGPRFDALVAAVNRLWRGPSIVVPSGVATSHVAWSARVPTGVPAGVAAKMTTRMTTGMATRMATRMTTQAPSQANATPSKANSIAAKTDHTPSHPPCKSPYIWRRKANSGAAAAAAATYATAQTAADATATDEAATASATAAAAEAAATTAADAATATAAEAAAASAAITHLADIVIVTELPSVPPVAQAPRCHSFIVDGHTT